MNSTDIIYQRKDDEILDAMIKDFINQYRPNDQRNRKYGFDTKFDVDLHRLIRAVYAEASKPYQMQMRNMQEMISLQTMIGPRNIKKE